MKRNGFIMSTYVYMLLVFFLLLLGTMLLVLNNTRLLSNRLRDDIMQKSGLSTDEVEFILSGDAEINLPRGTHYNEPGYTFKTVEGKDLTDIVKVTTNLNIYVEGTYTISYKAIYNGKTYKIYRVVNVT